MLSASLFVVAFVTGLFLHVLSIFAFTDWQERRRKWREAYSQWANATAPDQRSAGYPGPDAPSWRHPSALVSALAAVLSYSFGYLVAYSIGMLPA